MSRSEQIGVKSKGNSFESQFIASLGLGQARASLLWPAATKSEAGWAVTLDSARERERGCFTHMYCINKQLTSSQNWYRSDSEGEREKNIFWKLKKKFINQEVCSRHRVHVMWRWCVFVCPGWCLFELLKNCPVKYLEEDLNTCKEWPGPSNTEH